MAKGVTMISAVVFLALTISLIALVYHAAAPVIEKMQQSAAISRMKAVMGLIDEKIEEVASEGEGSRRVIDLDFTVGRLALDSAKNALIWHLDSKHLLMLPRTAEYLGNMVVGSNIETLAYEGVYNGYDAYVLENSHLKVYLRKIGSPDNPAAYNISDVLLAVYQKDIHQWMPLDFLDVTVDENQNSRTGTGYTYIERLGDSLPYGQVYAYMNSGYLNYTIRFTLESGTDFLKVEGVV